MTFNRLHVLASAAAAALCLGGAAQAAPMFTINPNVIPGTMGAVFDADFVNGNTSELLTAVNATTVTGSGWANFDNFKKNGAPANVFLESRIGIDYGLYLTFDLAATLTTGAMFAAGSEYALTQLNFTVYADPSCTLGVGCNTFTQADASSNTAATVSGMADDIVLGFGSLLTGVVGFNELGGAYINAINNFALCTGAGTAAVGATNIAAPVCADGTGRAYFAQPVPFYELAFSAFNNTTQGIERSGNRLSIQNAIGGVDFAGVPEPTSLALAGLALVALGSASLRKRKV